jgi:hypothetical protein
MAIAKAKRRTARVSWRANLERRTHHAVNRVLADRRHRRITRVDWKLLVLPAGIWIPHKGERLFIPHGEPERAFREAE